MSASAPNGGRAGQWRPKTGAPPPSARGSGASAAHGAAAAPDELASPMLGRPGPIGRAQPPRQGTGWRWAHTQNRAPPPNAHRGGATPHSAAAAGSAQPPLLLLQTCPRPVPASQQLWWRQNERSRSPPVHRGGDGGRGGALFNEECRRRRRAAAGRLNQPLCVSLILRLWKGGSAKSGGIKDPPSTPTRAAAMPLCTSPSTQKGHAGNRPTAGTTTALPPQH